MNFEKKPYVLLTKLNLETDIFEKRIVFIYRNREFKALNGAK